MLQFSGEKLAITSLQDVTILDPIADIQDIEVALEKAEPIKTLPSYQI